jgi:hypothetical protein
MRTLYHRCRCAGPDPGIFARLNSRNVSMDKALGAISQCRAQVTNRILIGRNAKQCGLRLSEAPHERKP